VGTILTFSTQGADPRRAVPRTATGGDIAEIIVFPRTSVHALRRWSEGDIGAERSIEGPGEKDPA
jgi:hypothetical protein